MPTPDRPEAEETQFPGLKDDSIPPPAEARPASPKRDTPRVEQVSFAERLAPVEMQPVQAPLRGLRAQSRRDFLIYGTGAALAAVGFWWALPPETQQRLGAGNAQATPRKEKLLNKALTLDDDVARLLYSPGHLATTFDRSQALSAEAFPVNYEGGMPDSFWGNYVPAWTLTLSGLASGKTVTLHIGDIQALIRRFGPAEQVTRLVCVEGWSAIGWWSGLRFADFLTAYPPMPGAKWVALRSKYNVAPDDNGNSISDPYYVSLDLETARHPQALLVTEQNGRPLSIGHGAPLRLRVPMKLGLKNIKAISSIEYTAQEPSDYWSSEGRGYSHYDGL